MLIVQCSEGRLSVVITVHSQEVTFQAQDMVNRTDFSVAYFCSHQHSSTCYGRVMDSGWGSKTAFPVT